MREVLAKREHSSSSLYLERLFIWFGFKLKIFPKNQIWAHLSSKHFYKEEEDLTTLKFRITTSIMQVLFETFQTHFFQASWLSYMPFMASFSTIKLVRDLDPQQVFVL